MVVDDPLHLFEQLPVVPLEDDVEDLHEVLLRGGDLFVQPRHQVVEGLQLLRVFLVQRVQAAVLVLRLGQLRLELDHRAAQVFVGLELVDLRGRVAVQPGLQLLDDSLEVGDLFVGGQVGGVEAVLFVFDGLPVELELQLFLLFDEAVQLVLEVVLLDLQLALEVPDDLFLRVEQPLDEGAVGQLRGVQVERALDLVFLEVEALQVERFFFDFWVTRGYL